MVVKGAYLRGFCLVFVCGFCLLAAGGGAAEYRTPSKTLVDIVDAVSTPAVSVDPAQRWLLLLERPSLPPISELAERELRLAGFRLRPRTHGPSRSRPIHKLSLQRIADGETRDVSGLPDAPRLENFTWSADGAFVAFTHAAEDGIEPWVLDVGAAEARRITSARLNLAAGTPPVWLPGGHRLIVALASDRGGEPAAAAVPIGPVIEENRGREAPARTYQDLLSSPHDEALFEHYFTSQLALLGLDGDLVPLAKPALYWRFSPAPSANYLLVETLHRPFSYRVPASRFPRRIEVWNLAGETVFELADLPLQEEIPMSFGSVATGPRRASWRADAPETLFWVEALDGGDSRAEAELRDRLFLLAAPFDRKPRPLIDLSLRFGGVIWGSDEVALVQESWWRSRLSRSWRLSPGKAEADPELLFERSYEDRYSDPGTPQTRINDAGRPVLRTSDGDRSLFLVGSGASPEGDRPFLDRFDLATKEATRLFHSAAPFFERPIALLDQEGRSLLTRRESPDSPANYFVRELGEDTMRQVTAFSHPTPQLVGIGKELLRYRRKDGVELTATLYTPAGYSRGQGPLPLLVWAYPREFKSAAAAGQVRDSPYRFDAIGGWSPLIWLARGYAVLNNPAMPIVGEGEAEPNDTYVEQLVASAEAAVNEVVRRGIAEPGRIAIGGHSYGAFMTANLLAHSDLFAAGIARSGAYNRTLTPFGFQSEERSLWQAPEIYFEMSPFMHADKVRSPILLIHGELDNNSGTFPLQSRRYYAALKGHGANARLVMLPYESHGYRSRESILHMLWETESWLERYLRQEGEGGRVDSTQP